MGTSSPKHPQINLCARVWMWKCVFGSIIKLLPVTQRKGISREPIFRVSRPSRKHNSDLSVSYAAHTVQNSFLDKQKSVSSWESGTATWWLKRAFTICWAALQPTVNTHDTKASMTRTGRGKRGWKCEGGVLKGRANSSWGMLICACFSRECTVLGVCVQKETEREYLQQTARAYGKVRWHSLHTELTCAESLKSCFLCQHFKQGALLKYSRIINLTHETELITGFSKS